MDITEKYYDLQELRDDIDRIIWNLDKKEMQEYIQQLYETMWEVEREMQQLEPEVRRIEDEEERARENEYWQGSIGGLY